MLLSRVEQIRFVSFYFTSVMFYLFVRFSSLFIFYVHFIGVLSERLERLTDDTLDYVKLNAKTR